MSDATVGWIVLGFVLGMGWAVLTHRIATGYWNCHRSWHIGGHQ